MQVSRQFILEAAGLVLTVALILLGVQFFERTKQILSLLSERQEQEWQYLLEYEQIRYEGLQITGSTAVSFTKEMVSKYGIPVTIRKEEGSCCIQTAKELAGLREEQSRYYVSPLTKFTCEVLRDDNSAIVGIVLDYRESEEKDGRIQNVY